MQVTLKFPFFNASPLLVCNAMHWAVVTTGVKKTSHAGQGGPDP